KRRPRRLRGSTTPANTSTRPVPTALASGALDRRAPSRSRDRTLREDRLAGTANSFQDWLFGDINPLEPCRARPASQPACHQNHASTHYITTTAAPTRRNELKHGLRRSPAQAPKPSHWPTSPAERTGPTHPRSKPVWQAASASALPRKE